MGHFVVCPSNGKDPAPDRAVRADRGPSGPAPTRRTRGGCDICQQPHQHKGPWRASLHSRQHPQKTLRMGSPPPPTLSHGLATQGAEDTLAGLCPHPCPPGT